MKNFKMTGMVLLLGMLVSMNAGTVFCCGAGTGVNSVLMSGAPAAEVPQQYRSLDGVRLTWVCPVPGCWRVFSTFQRFKDHMWSAHRIFIPFP